MAMFFRKKDLNSNQGPIAKFNMKKAIGFTLVAVFGILILAYAGVKSKEAVDRFSSVYQELRFAWEKPEFVKYMRESYQRKQKELDKGFLIEKKTSQEKLLDAVTDKLKDQSKE